MQLLQKIQTLTDAPKDEDQGTFYLICLLENM